MDEADELNGIMARTPGLRVIDVASANGMSPDTVRKFLRKERMNRTHSEKLRQYTRDLKAKSGQQNAAG